MDSKSINSDSPKIALVITQYGVRGAIIYGDTPSARKKSYEFLACIEPDLLDIQELLNAHILIKRQGAK